MNGTVDQIKAELKDNYAGVISIDDNCFEYLWFYSCFLNGNSPKNFHIQVNNLFLMDCIEKIRGGSSEIFYSLNKSKETSPITLHSIFLEKTMDGEEIKVTTFYRNTSQDIFITKTKDWYEWFDKIEENL